MTFCKVGVKCVPETNNSNLQIHSRTFQRKNTRKTNDLFTQILRVLIMSPKKKSTEIGIFLSHKVLLYILVGRGLNKVYNSFFWFCYVIIIYPIEENILKLYPRLFIKFIMR